MSIFRITREAPSPDVVVAYLPTGGVVSWEVGAAPPPPSGDITVSLVASRTSGPAPLAVHFSAIGTTSSISGVTDTFRQLLYTFGYGDTGSGAWPISGGSRNADVGGPLGAHVFETPGTYTVRCTASRGASSAFQEVTITVTDPATVYSGTNTVFISPSANYADAPVGSETRTTMPTIISNRRYILRRGESFGALNVPHAVTGTHVVAGPGGGAKPIVSSIQIGTGGQPPNANFPEDIVVQGLRCSGAIYQSSYMRRLLLKDCEQMTTSEMAINSAIDFWADPARYGASMPHPRELFIVGHYARGNTSAFGITGEFNQSAFLGCDFGIAQQHTLRIWSAYQLAIGHSALRGQSSDGIRHALKLQSRGPDSFALGSTYVDGDTYATRYVVVNDTVFSDAADNNNFACVVAPQNAVVDEGLEDVIVERCRFARGPNAVNDIELAGRRITAIGNTLVVGGGAAGVAAPGLSSGGLPSGWDGPYFSSRT